MQTKFHSFVLHSFFPFRFLPYGLQIVLNLRVLSLLRRRGLVPLAIALVKTKVQ